MFNIGDRIKIIENEGDENFYSNGDIGTLIRYYHSEKYPYWRVEFDYQKNAKTFDNNVWYVEESQMEKI